MRALGGLVLIAGLALAPVACGSSGPRADGREMPPLSMPDVRALDPAVQAQVQERYDALQAAIGHTRDAAALGTAYGQYGMVLQAAEFFDAAEPAYEHAQALRPADARWPYYLAHLHKSRGSLDTAESSFRRVLALEPDDLATLIWLGRLYLDQGRDEEAARMFARAAQQAPTSIAVLAGLGRTAMMQQDFTEAVRLFERALEIDPGADSLHALLATAYRASGTPEKAEPHLRQWQNRDVLVPDPRYQEIDMLLESGLAYELRGVRALESQDFRTAAEYFRRGLALTPDNTALRRSLGHKLGTALYAAGQHEAAVEQFRTVVRDAPPAGRVDEASGKAHYSLGILMMSRGDARQAVEHLEGAVAYQPTYVEAHIALGEWRRRHGQVRASLAAYEDALRLNPRAAQARWGSALALVRLQRYREAETWLTAAMALHPDRPEFAHLLARVLAAAPDAGVRDGERAMTIVETLLTGPKTVELGETLAMALAELGEYADAAAIQRGVLEAVQRGGLQDDARRLAATLRAYERGDPLRTVWVGEDVVGLQRP